MTEKYKDYTRSALINELDVYKHAINEGAQRIEERDQRITELQEENAKLKERLQRNLKHNCPKSEEFSIVSKLEHPLQVYVILNGEVIKGKVFVGCRDLLLVSPDGEEPTWFCQDKVFVTEAEAQKYLEEHK